MRFSLHHAHPWDVSPTEAVAIQRTLAPLVCEEPLVQPVRTVTGVDVSVRDDQVRTALVTVALPSLEPVEWAVWEGPVTFPYVPGLLSFREMPAVLPALERLETMPDVFMLDAQGLAHPRRFGLACHLGVLLDRPALGVAKSLLVGRFEGLEEAKGSTADLVHRKEVIGQAVRTRERVAPIFVSVGHRATLDDAVALTLATTGRFKIPEPTRLAHRLSKTGRL